MTWYSEKESGGQVANCTKEMFGYFQVPDPDGQIMGNVLPIKKNKN